MLLFVLLSVCVFFFFKQKTAYEMRISDWSSDVCSSDLCPVYISSTCALSVPVRFHCSTNCGCARLAIRVVTTPAAGSTTRAITASSGEIQNKIGRASCRERVCQYV